MRRLRLLLAAPLALALAACDSPTDAGGDLPPGMYVMHSYNGSSLPTAEACGSYTIVTGAVSLLHGQALRAVDYRDAAGSIHPVRQNGRYTVLGNLVKFDLVEPDGSHWKVNGVLRNGRLELEYPAPCDGTELESYLVP